MSVYVLDPGPFLKRTFLCEGLASWFQTQLFKNLSPTDPRSVKALNAVKRLMPRLREVVRDRRVHRHIPIHCIRFHHLEPLFLNVTEEMADDLFLLDKPFLHI